MGRMQQQIDRDLKTNVISVHVYYLGLAAACS